MNYEQVADKIGLDQDQKCRFIHYMKARWANTETEKCQTGYAHEWAYRFQHGMEWRASDHLGQAILATYPKATP